MWFAGNQVSSAEVPDPVKARGLAYWESRLAEAISSGNLDAYRSELGVIGQWCFHGLAHRFDREAPGVATSILEGLDEVLTVNRLKLPAKPRVFDPAPLNCVPMIPDQRAIISTIYFCAVR